MKPFVKNLLFFGTILIVSEYSGKKGGSMPYRSRRDLPEGVRDALPAIGEAIYQKTFNNAWEYYKDPQKRSKGGSREEVARRVAWSAVKHVYQKNQRTGKWERK